MHLNDLAINAIKAAKQKSPEILTGFGAAGVIITGYLAAKAGKKHSARMSAEAPDMPLKEEAKLVWKIYIPTGISGVLTIACILGAAKEGGRRTAAAVTAYSVTEHAFSEYKEKVVEQIGKNKEQKIRDQIIEEKVKENPSKKDVVILPGGQVLCCEMLTGRYFMSDMETLKKTVNEINSRIFRELYVTLDEFYDILGLDHTTFSCEQGWDSSKLLDLQFTTVLNNAGVPCLAFEYNYVKPLD